MGVFYTMKSGMVWMLRRKHILSTGGGILRGKWNVDRGSLMSVTLRLVSCLWHYLAQWTVSDTVHACLYQLLTCNLLARRRIESTRQGPGYTPVDLLSKRIHTRNLRTFTKRLHATWRPLTKRSKAPFARYNRLSNPFDNRFDKTAVSCIQPVLLLLLLFSSFSTMLWVAIPTFSPVGNFRVSF